MKSLDAKLDENSIIEFDAAVSNFVPDSELTSGSPGRDLTKAISAFVRAVSDLNVDKLQRSYNWYERLTGLDLEERINFELATQSLNGDMRKVQDAADTVRLVRAALKKNLAQLGKVQVSNVELIQKTHLVLEDQDSHDHYAVRLQRRLSNAEAVHSANRMAEAQINLTIESLSSLLDSHADLEQMLFPLWQQHAMAIAQGWTSPEELKGAFAGLSNVRAQINDKLSETGIVAS